MNKRTPILLGILLVFISLWLQITPNWQIHNLMERLDNLGYDLQLRTRVLTEHLQPASPVAIIDIDDRSLKAEGRWPWSRSKVAELVNRLQKEGAAVIAFDIFFSEPEDNIAELVAQKLNKKYSTTAALTDFLSQNKTDFDNDKILANSLADAQAVLAIGFVPRKQTQNILSKPLLTLNMQQQAQLDIIKAGGYISNISMLQKVAKGAGFINIFADGDGIIRHAPLIMDYNNAIYPALPLQAVLTFLDEKIQLVTPTYGNSMKLEGIQIGAHFIPTDEEGQVLIPFIGKSYTFPYYSATDVIHGNIPRDALLGKILFVGTSATGLGDLQATAIQNPFPGVEIQATLVNGILLGNFSYKPAWIFGAQLFLTFLLGLIAAAWFPYLGPRTLGIFIFMLPPALLMINNWFWSQTGLVLSLLVPVALVLLIALFNILYGYLFETRRRERLKEMFGQYVPAKHIDEMLRSTGGYGLHGENREMSVLFADIRSFTTISEGLTAENLVEMLNTFFTPMTEIIFKHRGTIDKYVGDMIMAFWGAPLKDKNHARHAIESALEMQAQVKLLRPIMEQHNWPEINIGIGINSGEMSVGDMGSRFRRNYTVLGDAVNLGSRAEGLTKFYGAEIIVTENTHHNQPKFIFRQLDKVRVKGKKHGVAIYEVIGLEANAPPELKQELALYHQALEDYFQQKWDSAYARMQQLHEAHPQKKIYKLYIERITEFKQHPPASDWDGIYVHASK
jgi:adenylate cyclase